MFLTRSDAIRKQATKLAILLKAVFSPIQNATGFTITVVIKLKVNDPKTHSSEPALSAELNSLSMIAC